MWRAPRRTAVAAGCERCHALPGPGTPGASLQCPHRPLRHATTRTTVTRDVKDRRCSASEPGPQERRATDRRRHVLHAPRRADERAASAVDWHHPQWLAIAMLIVMFSGIDALLTLMLVERGAYEANPMMAPLVGGSAVAFTLVKIGLTGGGVVLLTQLARMRAFGRIPVGVLLYTVLGIYGALIAYEFGLLNAL